MTTAWVYEPKQYTFTNENTVTINHKLNRDVNVEVYVGNDLVDASIEKDSGDPLNTVIIKFYEGGSLSQQTGKVVIG